MEKNINKAIILIVVILIILVMLGVFYYYQVVKINNNNQLKDANTAANGTKIESNSGNICLYDNQKAVCNELIIYPPMKITDQELIDLKNNFMDHNAEIIDSKELRGLGWITYRLRFQDENDLFALKENLEQQQFMVGYNKVNNGS